MKTQPMDGQVKYLCVVHIHRTSHSRAITCHSVNRSHPIGSQYALAPQPVFVSVCSTHTQPKYRAVPKAGSLPSWHHGVVRVDSTAPCTMQAVFSNKLATAMDLWRSFVA
jgi:hypothetical protein